ncbi:uncharacterized protein LOC132643809 [Lycium barbarum]|uniref:uncharacterized protein LOC132643809 n=1 Tax=Lycium barbarum TaxID=112863 RepID=UPI00293E2E4B|nr:uncharacterized protein LOC132643809 [Lycium barbarum]
MADQTTDDTTNNTTVQQQNAATTVAEVKIYDSSNPYYIHPSDSPSMSLVNSIFDGRCYGGWRKGVLIALSAKNKVGFIDGAISQPSNTAETFKSWARCNDMEISETTQGNSNIAGYYTKLKRLWDELDSLDIYQNCTCDCSCGGKTKNQNSLQDGRLIQFLMKLNEAYASARSSFLLLSPLPSVNHTNSLLIRDEKQREVQLDQHVGEGAFLAAKQPSYHKGESSNSASKQPYMGQKFQYEKKGYSEPKKEGLFCNYCKKTNHTIDNCYRLIGFPSDFKFTISKRYSVAKGNAVISGDNVSTQQNNTGDQPMTQDQYHNLYHLLQTVKMSGQPEQTPENIVSANCAGPFNEEATGSW